VSAPLALKDTSHKAQNRIHKTITAIRTADAAWMQDGAFHLVLLCGALSSPLPSSSHLSSPTLLSSPLLSSPLPSSSHLSSPLFSSPLLSSSEEHTSELQSHF